jgi:hypothetical protein
MPRPIERCEPPPPQHRTKQIQRNMSMKVLQISKQGLPTEVMELVDISEPDAPKAGGLLAAVEYS